MKALFDAIFARTAATPLSTTITGLHNTEAPPKSVFPYAVVQLVTGITAEFTSLGFTESYLVQFNLFDDAPDMGRLLDTFAALTAAFDLATFAVDGYVLLDCVRQSTLQTRVEGVWMINVVYRIKLR